MVIYLEPAGEHQQANSLELNDSENKTHYYDMRACILNLYRFIVNTHTSIWQYNFKHQIFQDIVGCSRFQSKNLKNLLKHTF